MDATDHWIGYGAAAPRAPLGRSDDRSRGDVVLRVVLTLVVLGAALLGAAVLAFVALVVWEGCFIACSAPDPQPGLGLLWGVAAVSALVAGGWAVRRVWRMRPGAVRAWAWLLAGVVVAYLVFAAVAAGLQTWADMSCREAGQIADAYSYPRCPVPTAGWVGAWAAATVPVVAAGRLAWRPRRRAGP